MKTIKIFAIAIATSSLISCGNNGVTKKSLNTELDSVSYAIGLDMANKIKVGFKDVDSDLFVQGYKNGIDSTNLLIDSKEINNIIRNYFQRIQQEQMKEQQAKALAEAEEKYADVKKAGIEFLEKNKTDQGVKTTESGLQYRVINEGKGEKPEATSKIKLHYHGTLIDGTVFDSSVDKGKPIEMRANQFVKGFSEGLLLMNKGAKYRFYIPQELAYGAFPRGGTIKPFSALIFDVELLDIVQK